MPRPKTPKIPKHIDAYLTALVENTSTGKQVLRVRKGEKLFAQGDTADAIFFLQTGKVKISVVSRAGKEAVLALLGPPNFFGEGSLVGQSLRLDQLFNQSEKRLARVLLKLARLRDQNALADSKVLMLSHETLAEMVGTTRSRITHFMNKFRTMGLIEYNGELHIRTELLTELLLHD